MALPRQECRDGNQVALDEADPKRINVAITPETARALKRVIAREGISLTEAVRRLMGYGEFVYTTIKENRTALLVRSDDSDCEVVLL